MCWLVRPSILPIPRTSHGPTPALFIVRRSPTRHGLAKSGGQATFTVTRLNNSCRTGCFFTVSGVTPSGYNGTYTALSVSGGTTITAALVSNPGSFSRAGTFHSITNDYGVSASRFLRALEVDPNNKDHVIVSTQYDGIFETFNGTAGPERDMGSIVVRSSGSIQQRLAGCKPDRASRIRQKLWNDGRVDQHRLHLDAGNDGGSLQDYDHYYRVVVLDGRIAINSAKHSSHYCYYWAGRCLGHGRGDCVYGG